MSDNTSVKTRQSGIELLKVIAMFGIVFYHCIWVANWENSPFLQYVGISKATAEPSGFILQMLCYLGTLGNLIFLVSSVWFLLEKSDVKLSKIANMILDAYVISVMFLLIFSGGGGGKPFGQRYNKMFIPHHIQL